VESFANDLYEGIYFESTIPEGFGLGSSGALIAALYDKYVDNDISPEKMNSGDLAELKVKLAQLESFYHGTSSGIDPLNSLMMTPLLFGDKGEITKVDIHLPVKNQNFAVFLINSKTKGETGPLVNIFLEKTKHKGNKAIDVEYLNELTNSAIRSIIQGKNRNFFTSLRRLSAYQLHHFGTMIPEGFYDIWQYGLDNGKYFLKLCGSGGGGFLLGFTNDLPAIRMQMAGKGLEVIPVYVHKMSE
jgi:mevalonate kinase